LQFSASSAPSAILCVRRAVAVQRRQPSRERPHRDSHHSSTLPQKPLGEGFARAASLRVEPSRRSPCLRGLRVRPAVAVRAPSGDVLPEGGGVPGRGHRPAARPGRRTGKALRGCEMKRPGEAGTGVADRRRAPEAVTARGPDSRNVLHPPREADPMRATSSSPPPPRSCWPRPPRPPRRATAGTRTWSSAPPAATSAAGSPSRFRRASSRTTSGGAPASTSATPTASTATAGSRCGWTAAC
jgi:hypothetical protein